MTAPELDEMVARLNEYAGHNRMSEYHRNVMTDAAAAIVSLRDERDDAVKRMESGWIQVCAEPAIKHFKDRADKAEAELAATQQIALDRGNDLIAARAQLAEAQAQRETYRNAWIRSDEFLAAAQKKNADVRKALLDANDMCRSAYAIADREFGGRGTTNWKSFRDRLMESLDRQHTAISAASKGDRAESAQRSPPRELWAIASKYLDCYVRQSNVPGGIHEADADRAYLSQLEDAAPQTDAKDKP